jgi:DNA-binding protein YbaB
MPEPDGFMRDLQESIVRNAALHERLAALTGRAEGLDGLVRVVCTADDPVHELTLDPRALRRPAEDVAEAVRQAIRTAKLDLERQVGDAMREEAGTAGALAFVTRPGLAQAKLAQLADMIGAANKETTQVMDRVRGRLGT